MRLNRIILLLFISIYLADTSFAQNKQIDSLLLVLKNAKEDTNKVYTLNALAEQMCYEREYKVGIQYSETALSLSEKLNFTKGKGTTYEVLGIINFSQENSQESSKYYLKALKIQEELKENRSPSIYLPLGANYLNTGDYAEALKYFYLALNFYEELRDKGGIASALQSIGTANYYLGNDTIALKNSFASLKIREEDGDSVGMAVNYNEIGRIYYRQGKYSEALEKRFTALKIYKAGGLEVNPWGVGRCYVGIGNIYKRQGELAYSKGDKPAAKNKFSEALKYYLASLKIWGEIESKSGVADLYVALGNIYVKLKKFSEARDYLEKGLELSKTIRYKGAIRDAYKSLSSLDSIQGNFKSAYAHFIMYFFYRDSLVNEESVRKSESYKMRYEFTKQEDSLRQQHLFTETKLIAQKKQRYFYWSGLAMLAALSFFVFLNFRNQKKINRLAKDAHAKEKAELELQSLRAQLNPHFMFNSLNAIQELILLEENEKSQSYLARFAKLLRMLLENADKPFIPLQREIDFLQLYLSLENLRIPDFQHLITVDRAIDTEQTMIPNMILQPYIENAIWHGLSHKPNDKKLEIRIKKTDGEVKYEIEDNGVGRKKSAELKSLFRKEHKSKGMELLSKRFKLLAKEYGSDIETGIDDVINNGDVAGTLVTIKVPSKFSETNKNRIS